MIYNPSLHFSSFAIGEDTWYLDHYLIDEISPLYNTLLDLFPAKLLYTVGWSYGDEGREEIANVISTRKDKGAIEYQCLYYINILRHKKLLESIVDTISNNMYAARYIPLLCANEDNPILWKHLAKEDHRLASSQYEYCSSVKDREEIWKALANCDHPDTIYWKYKYCKHVKDRPEMWQSIIRDPDSSHVMYLYLRDVCDREEMREALFSRTSFEDRQWQQEYLNWKSSPSAKRNDVWN